jgi:hypothetical protein
VRRIAVLVFIGVVLLVLVVGQLVLPGIAEQRLRDRLSHNGTVLSVKVSAFPAITLLWHHADKVVIRMASYESASGKLGSQLDEAGGVGTLDASTQVFRSGLLTLRNASLHKHGDQLTGTATVTEQDLRGAVPFLDNVQPVASGSGALTLRGSATLFGVNATADATVAAQDGKLVVAPNVPFGGLATLTLFDDPHLAIEDVGASPAAGGFTVSATARLRSGG